MKKRRVAIDLDGIAYNWCEAVNGILLDRFGIELGEWDSWDYGKRFMTRDQWRWLWQHGARHGMFRQGSTYPGTSEAMHRMSEIANIVIITHRPKQAVHATLEWLTLQEWELAEVHIAHGVPKSMMAQPCDFYVDDSPTVAEDLATNTPGTVLLWDRPWNAGKTERAITADLEKTRRVVRVQSWEEVEKLVRDR